MVLFSLATTEDHPTDAIVDDVSPPRTVIESSDDEEMVYSYKVMYEKLVKALNEN